MSEEDVLLTTFLNEPQNRDARQAYAAWLKQQNDPRAEYFCLSTGVGSSSRNGPDVLAWRLGQLRARLDPAWADAIARARISTTGVYQSDTIDNAWHYLRFYPDRSVVSVCSTQSPSQVCQLFNESKDHRALSRGIFTFSMRGDQLNFSLIQQPPDWMYPAWKALYVQRLDEDIARDFDFIAADAAIRQHAKELEAEMKSISYAGAPDRQTLHLNWHRPLDGSGGTLTYRFAGIT